MTNAKYAVVFLCMLKDHYVVGACIAAFIHRCFIKQLDYKIDLVIMCDEYIFNKYYDLLKQYFDKLKILKLINYPLDAKQNSENSDSDEDLLTKTVRKKYYFPKEKYASWISYSTNKWRCLKLTKYEKVLFMDIDMLPSQIEFYNIFNFNTPCILRCVMTPRVIPKCNEKYEPYTGTNYNDFIVNHMAREGSLDGGLILLKPSLSLYKKYKKLTNKYFSNGIYSSFLSFPDETSLFYCLSKNGPMYTICYDYSRIPWDTNWNWTTTEIKTAFSYNFNSFVKPWIVPRKLLWKEGLIWHDIYNILSYNKQLDELYNESINEHYEFFKKLPYDKQKKRYNLDDSSSESDYDSDDKYGKLNTIILEKCILNKI